MRKLTEFIVWNHIFVLFETWRSFRVKEYALCTLAGGTLVLSTIRHLYHEKCLNTIEPLVAKSAELYMMGASIYYLKRRDMMKLILSKFLIYAVWKYQYYNYEKIHPWLHVLIAIDAHYYINCFKSHKMEKITGTND